jgi:hypothetical protein
MPIVPRRMNFGRRTTIQHGLGWGDIRTAFRRHERFNYRPTEQWAFDPVFYGAGAHVPDSEDGGEIVHAEVVDYDMNFIVDRAMRLC